MDPITNAAKRFLSEAEAFYRACPGAILPMFAEPSARGELVKTLRLQELLPGNRRPLILYEEPFLGADAYFDGLAAVIESDYALLREGAREEGTTLMPFALPGAASRDSLGALQRVARAIERVGQLLGVQLDGASVALLPSRVEDDAAWQESVGALGKVRFSPGVRLCVFNPPGGPLNGVLGEVGAHFRVDAEELSAYLAGLGSEESKGPIDPRAPALTEEQQRAKQSATQLKGLLRMAVEKTRVGQFEEAVKLYGEARKVCQAGALGVEEGVVLIALGGSHLAMGALDRSIESYREAALVAESRELWPIAAQAWLGVGGACVAAGCPGPAAEAYEAAAGAAKLGEVEELRAEALRLAERCLQAAGAA